MPRKQMQIAVACGWVKPNLIHCTEFLLTQISSIRFQRIWIRVDTDVTLATLDDFVKSVPRGYSSRAKVK